MSIACRCGHGESWHTRPERRRYSAFDGELCWKKVKGACQFEGCECKKYHYKPREDFTATYWSPEQVQLNEELRLKDKENRIGIVVDKDFHELFCKVLKQETERECDCEGTTSEIR